MDETSFLCEIALALDGILALYFSMKYLVARRLYDSFETALKDGINSVNVTDIEQNKPTLSIVRGQVKALAPQIKSLSNPTESGVIQNFTIKEHVMRRFNEIWTNERNILDSKYNIIPFELKDENFRITITSPLMAEYLRLPLIKDHFEPSDTSIMGLLCGVHRKGFQYTEYLLRENDILTGFGEMVFGENQKLHLIPPRNGMKYILTTTDPEALVIQLKSEKIFYKFWSSLFGVIGVTLVGVLLYKWWKRKQAINREKKLLQMVIIARLERQRTEPRNRWTEESMTCAVCLNQPREVILLPCGHICMCFDCTYQYINRPCPICRQEVSSVQLFYFS